MATILLVCTINWINSEFIDDDVTWITWAVLFFAAIFFFAA